MMSKTHLFIGTAAALAVVHPDTLGGCVVAVIAGAAGGAFPDMDRLKWSRKSGRVNFDAIISLLFVVLAAAIGFMLDRVYGLDLLASLLRRPPAQLGGGLALLLVLYVTCLVTPHRSFSHSLLCAALLSLAVWLLYPSAWLPCAAGAVSHLALDLFNKKGMRLFFPARASFCFGFFEAGGIANALFLSAGFCGTVFLLLNALWLHMF